jgi:hypothetical protein
VATLPKLRMAKKDLGLDVSNQHLLLLSRHESASTEQDIVSALREAGHTASATDIANLLVILTEANGGAQPAVAPVLAAVVDEIEEVKPVVPQAVKLGGPDQEDRVVSVPVEVEEEPEEAEAIDPADYQEVDIMGRADEPIQTLDIQQNPAGGLIVSWKPSKKKGSVYVLVSGSGDFPRVIRGGQASWTTKANSRKTRGEHNIFSLFIFNALGEKGQLFAQGRVIGEVSIKEVQPYEDQVRLRWETGDQLARVRVYRSKADSPLPEHPTAAMALPVSDGGDSYIDTDVEPGQEFEYKACLEWQGPDGQVIASAGQKVTVIIPGNISNVTGFAVIRSDENSGHVDIEFDDVARGSVKIFQIKGQPRPELLAAKAGGTDIESDRLMDAFVQTWLGTEVIDLARSADGKVSIKNVPMLSGGLDSRTYTAVGVLGKNARICDVKVIQQVGEIDAASVIDRFDYQLLRVGLPAGAQSLEIWLKNPTGSQETKVADLGTPDRTVQIDTEYRRFGGVLFANNVPGLPGLTKLQAEPLSIFMRGISTFEGASHKGPIFQVEYPGRVAVAFRRTQGVQTGSSETRPRGFGALFRREEATHIALGKDNPLELRVQSPTSLSGAPIDLIHYAAKAFPLDAGSPAAKKKPFIRVIPSTFSNWGQPAISTAEGQHGPVMLERDYQFRIASASPQIAGTPIFCIDDRVGSFATIPMPEAAINAELSIVLVGAKQSGKTTYVQALLNYFEQQLSQIMGAKLLLKDENDEVSKARFEDMHKFVKTGVLPPGTRSARQFLAASADAPKDPADPTNSLNFKFFNGGNIPLAGVSLIDVAGEDMDSLETMRFYKDALVKADLVIFLMDPLQIPSVQTALAGFPLPPRGTDPFLVMQHLCAILEEGAADRNLNQKVAVTLSKFDSFEKISAMQGSPIAGTIQKGMQITRDPNSNSGHLFNALDGHLVQEEILSILERLDIAPFKALVQNTFGPIASKFFVISSLGHGTHAAQMDSAGITSYRVSDPIRWALQGVLDARQD